MNILMVGDIVGSPGRGAFAEVVGRLREAGTVDFVVVNAENAAGGRGLTRALANELLAAGADVITLGDHTWDQKELAHWISDEPRVIRPANFAPDCPGRGLTTVVLSDYRVTVINLVGRVFMAPTDCPFRRADALLRDPAEVSGVVLVDMHAEATSEKVAMGWHLAGRVSAVLGTHTHVQTSDEQILPGGTAYLTDVGMTGPKHSIIGRSIDNILPRFLTGMPTRFEIARDRSRVFLEGALLVVDPESGRAETITRVREQAVNTFE